MSVSLTIQGQGFELHAGEGHRNGHYGFRDGSRMSPPVWVETDRHPRLALLFNAGPHVEAGAGELYPVSAAPPAYNPVPGGYVYGRGSDASQNGRGQQDPAAVPAPARAFAWPSPRPHVEAGNGELYPTVEAAPNPAPGGGTERKEDRGTPNLNGQRDQNPTTLPATQTDTPDVSQGAAPLHSGRPVPPASKTEETLPAPSEPPVAHASRAHHNKVTEIAIEGGATMKAADVQRALKAAEQNIGTTGDHGVDNDFRDKSWAAVDHLREKFGDKSRIGKHELSVREATALSNPEMLKRFAQADSLDVSGRLNAAHDSRIAHAAKPHADEHSVADKTVAKTPSTAPAQTAGTEINDGHGHKVRIDPALAAKTSIDLITKVEKLTGGEAKDGAVVDAKDFEARIALIKQQFSDKGLHFKDNANPTIDRVVASLSNLAEKEQNTGVTTTATIGKPLITPKSEVLAMNSGRIYGD